MILASEEGPTELVLGRGSVLAVEAKARRRQLGAMATLAPGAGATMTGGATGTWRLVGVEHSVTPVRTTEE